MSLFSLIINASVASAMAQNSSLAAMNSTTLAMAGTSIPTIQNNALNAATTSAGTYATPTQLYAPLQAMQTYALSASPGNSVAINNAAVLAQSQVDSSFSLSTVGSDASLFDLQNASRTALSSGISAYGTSLQSISPALVQPALTVGNTSLSTTGTVLDNVCTASYGAATSSVASQTSAVSSDLATAVAAKNAAITNDTSLANLTASTASPLTSDPTSGGTNSLGIFQSAATSTGLEGTPNATNNNTDLQYQDIKVYVEGVQVPFEAITINQQIGALPTATIQIPPQQSLMDITRYYQPKVHIFFTDQNLGGDRLLFWGHIIAANYAKSRQAGMSTISFRCMHKNALVNEVTLEWSDYVNNAITGGGDANSQAAVAQVTDLNSKQSLLNALKGITGMQSDTADLIDPSNTDVMAADITKLDQKWTNLQTRWIGMPAAMMNLWNQIKQSCYAHPGLNTVLSRIYIPLMEEGLGFFDRITGHYVLENLIQNSKQPYCDHYYSDNNGQNPQVMSAPVFRLPSITAISTSLSLEALLGQLQLSGEMSTFAQLFQDFYYSVEYEMVTLASPALVPADATVTVNPDVPSLSSATPMMAVETVIKPQIPFYYSPICNVLFPKMYTEISIDQEEDIVPTRITAYHDNLMGQGGANSIGSNYRAPNSIREAIAVGIALVNQQQNNTSSTASTTGTSATSPVDVNLQNTTGASYNVPGKYEQGRGLRHRKIALPNWLAMFLAGRLTQSDTTAEEWPAQGTTEYNQMLNLYAAWVDRYGYDIVMNDGTITKTRNTQKDTLNPYSVSAQIHPSQRLLFATSDYEFTKQVLQARTGMVNCIFNPYIVPGYPMDVLDESPNHPSFHGMCSAVTHTITSRSINTTVGIVGAMTYAEMSNYYIAPVHPWLQTALNMLNVTWGAATTPTSSNPSGSTGSDANPSYDSSATDAQSTGSTTPTSDTQEYGDVSNVQSVRQTIIGNPTAKATADTFYQSVFGITAAAPDQIYDFQTGQPIPVRRASGQWGTGTGQSLPQNNGGEGNDYLTSVGNLRLVSRPIEGKVSIKSKFGLQFIDLTPQNYTPSSMSYQNPILSTDMLLEPGASLFLDYQETSTFVGASWDNQTATSTTNEAGANSSSLPATSQ
jgi:hypothetical protein